QRLDEVVHAAASLARLPRDDGHAGEHVLDAVIELGDEQVLALFGMLVIRNVERKPAHVRKLAGGVEFSLGRLLQPYFATVPADEAEGRVQYPPLRGAHTPLSQQLRLIFRMHAGEEFCAAEILLGIEAEDDRGIVAA